MADFKQVKEVVIGTKRARFGGGELQIRANVWEVGEPPMRGLGIREWWQSEDGGWLPSKNGVTVRPQHFNALRELMALADPGETAQAFTPVDPGSVEWTFIAESRYAGRCSVCGEQYAEGAQVGFDPHGQPGRKGAHWGCTEPEDEAEHDELAHHEASPDPRELF